MPSFFMDSQLLPPVAQLDAGNSACYSGSGQTFANGTVAPIDGELQTAYDFYRGATSSSEASDPTFNGVAGALTSSEFFSFDGGDYMTLIGSNTTFINSMHKDNALFSILMWIRTPASYGVTDHGLFGTDAGGGAGIHGVDFSIRNSGAVGLRQCDGISPSITLHSTVATMTTGTDYFVAVTQDESNATNGLSIYINSAVEHFSGAYSTPSVSAATNKLQLGCMGNNAFPIASGGRIYQMILFNRKLPDGQVQGYYQRYRSRYGLP